MDSDIVIFLSGIVFFILALFGWGYVNNVADNDAINALVSKGVTPIEAKCAIRPNENDHVCFLLALKKAQ